MNNTFGSSTQPLIRATLAKNNARVLVLLMFVRQKITLRKI